MNEDLYNDLAMGKRRLDASLATNSDCTPPPGGEIIHHSRPVTHHPLSIAGARGEGEGQEAHISKLQNITGHWYQI